MKVAHNDGDLSTRDYQNDKDDKQEGEDVIELLSCDKNMELNRNEIVFKKTKKPKPDDPKQQ